MRSVSCMAFSSPLREAPRLPSAAIQPAGSPTIVRCAGGGTSPVGKAPTGQGSLLVSDRSEKAGG